MFQGGWYMISNSKTPGIADSYNENIYKKLGKFLIADMNSEQEKYYFRGLIDGIKAAIRILMIKK